MQVIRTAYTLARLTSLAYRNIWLLDGTNIFRHGTDYPVISILLKVMGDPSCNSVTREDCRHHIIRHSQGLENYSRIEFDIRFDLPLLPHNRLRLLRYLQPLSRLRILLRKLSRNILQNQGSRIIGPIDPVSKTHYLIPRRQLPVQKRLNIPHAPDLLHHLHRHLIRTTMQWTSQRSDRTSYRPANVGKG